MFLTLSAFLLMFSASFIDSLRGPILPQIQSTLNLSNQQSSYFLSAGHLAAVITSLLLIRLLGTFGDKKCTLCCLFASSLILPLSLYLRDLSSFVALGALFGFSNTCLGTFSNILLMRSASLERQASLLSFLHSFFGIGSLTAAAFLGLLFKWQIDWQWTVVFFTLCLIVSSVSVSKIENQKATPVEAKENTSRNMIEISKNKRIFAKVLFVSLFALYVSGEVGISMWMVSFLVKVKGWSVDSASFQLSLFFLVLSAARLLCFWLATPRTVNLLMFGCVAISVIMFFVAILYNAELFFTCGLVGPFFPLLMGSIKSNFAEEWRNVTVIVVVGMQVTLGLLHSFLGLVADAFGLANAYFIPGVCFIALLALIIVYQYFQRESSSLALI